MATQKVKTKPSWHVAIFFGSLVQAIFGVSSAMLLIGLVASIVSGDSAAFISLGITFGLFAMITKSASSSVKRVRRFPKYLEFLINQKVSSLEDVAREMNIKYALVVKDLRIMIKKQYLKGATIDNNRKTIRIPALIKQQEQQQQFQLQQQQLLLQQQQQLFFQQQLQQQQYQPQANTNPLLDHSPKIAGGNGGVKASTLRQVTCPGCGAHNITKEEGGCCEYCDSPLS